MSESKPPALTAAAATAAEEDRTTPAPPASPAAAAAAAAPKSKSSTSSKRPRETSTPRRQQRRPRRVIVIGAGMSGLACARELQSRHYEVLVVEARNRVGGRLKGGALQVPGTASAVGNGKTSVTSSSSDQKKKKPPPNGGAKKKRNGGLKKGQEDESTPTESSSSSFTHQHVDLGGALIHGIDENPVYSLAVDDLGVPVRSVQDCLLMNDSGWPVDPKEDAVQQAVFNECLEESFRRTTPSDSDAVATNSTARRATRSSVLSAQQSSFGDLFDQVCREKSVSSTALLRWHQANLEVSCGAGFDRLGWQWNEDEPYGFDGDHVALQTSWKAVVEALAEQLVRTNSIWYQAPVTRIQIVHPTAAAVAAAEQYEQQRQQELREREQQQQLQAAKKKKLSPAVAASAAAAAATSSPVLVPTRQSRRLRGEDATVRRSRRSNKGAAVERFTVDRDGQVVVSSSQSNTAGDNNGNARSSNGTRASSTAPPPPPVETVVQVTVHPAGPGGSKEPVVLQADAVVCTLPLGILKLSANDDDNNNNNNHEGGGGVVFDPPLPAAKLQAIDRLGTGLLNKCALSFSHIFWQDSDFLGLAEEAHSYLVLNVAAYTGQPILMFMYGGNFAKEIEEWTDQDIVQDCLTVLKKICGRIPAQLLDYQVTRWGYEQYSRMAFTYVPPGVDGFAELSTMNQPLYDYREQVPVLMFAGEHTTPYHPSTIHGAFLSGIREAYRLDCALAPEAIGNLRFSEEELYERTFVMEKEEEQGGSSGSAKKKKKTGAARASSNQQLNGSHHGSSTTAKKKAGSRHHKQHRRRGAAGVMKLRSRQATSTTPTRFTRSSAPDEEEDSKPVARSSCATNTPAETATAAPATAPAAAATTATATANLTSPTRRSQRSTAGQVASLQKSGLDGSVAVGGAAAAVGVEAALSESELSALEDRILLRSVESYGPDYEFIQENVLPVHGGSTTGASDTTTRSNNETLKSQAQVRQRCQQLVRTSNKEAGRQRPSRPKNLLKSWAAVAAKPSR